MDFRSFFDSLAEGMVVYNSVGEVIDANRSAVEFLDVSPDETLRDKISGLVFTVSKDGKAIDSLDRPGYATFRTGKSITAKIMGGDVPGRGLRWVSLNARRLNVDGEPVGVVISFLDITDKRKSELAVEMFMDLNRYVVNATDEADLLQHLTDTVVKVGQYPLAWIGVASGAEGGIEAIHSSGDTDYLFDSMPSWWGSTESGRDPTGTALRTGVTQVANGLATDPEFDSWRDRAAQFKFASCIAIPLFLTRQKAVLTIYDRHSSAFNEVTVERLTRIFSEYVFATAHVRSIKQLESTVEGTLSALALMTETRDPYTAGHQNHVGALGEAIAKQLGLNSKLITLIRQSGEVHDIGKIAVPAEILTRPGRLSPLEFEMIKRHTLVGADILSQASLPWPIAEVALQHHERMNGSGYPRGLPGSDIILPARIIAVADVVEAMTQHRPYRPALGIDRAIAEVSAGAGTLFDPEVVGACLAVFESGFTFESGDEVDRSRIE